MCKRGDIYMAKLSKEYDGSLQAGDRPVLIVSNNKANEFSPVITIVPITSNLKKKWLPTHVVLKCCGLPRKSIVLAEQITSINKSCLVNKLGSIEKTDYEKLVETAIGIQLANLEENQYEVRRNF